MTVIILMYVLKRLREIRDVGGVAVASSIGTIQFTFDCHDGIKKKLCWTMLFD